MHILTKKNIPYLLLIILIVAAGIYFRLKGLGKWPLAVDEYYIIKSVKNILTFGLPHYPTGGYYERGILYQYLTAGLIYAGAKAEFAGRIITVATNIITLIPLYLLGKKLSGRLLAIMLVFVFSFSVWEIEMARFARMYAPFQMIFAFYIYFLYRNLIENNDNAFRWMLLLSFIGIFTYEASIFLALLNFIPLVWDKNDKTINLSRIFRANASYILSVLLILIISYLFLNVNFRSLGTPENYSAPVYLPPSGEASPDYSEGQLRIPKLLILTLYSSKIFTIAFIIPLIISLFSIFKISQHRIITNSGKITFICLILLSFLNLFGLILVLALLFYLLGWIRKEDIKEAAISVIPAIFINFSFWTVFAIKTNLWHKYFPYNNLTGITSVLKVLWKEFLNYPYLYETYKLFRETMPLFTYITIILLLAGIILLVLKKKENDNSFRLMFSIFILLFLMINILNLTYFKTRYFFFLYPLTLLLIFSTIARYTTEFIKYNKAGIYFFAFLSIIIFVSSEDFNLNHIINIDSSSINYRVNLNRDQKDHYYPRWDTRTPADSVNKYLNPSDIVVTNEQVNEFYLKKLDYIYIDYRGKLSGVSADNGKKELWTTANLIYDDQQLISFLNNTKKRRWVIINKVWGTRFLEKDGFFTNFRKYLYYANPDSSAVLYKIQ